jgi:hypothetical protein
LHEQLNKACDIDDKNDDTESTIAKQDPIDDLTYIDEELLKNQEEHLTDEEKQVTCSTVCSTVIIRMLKSSIFNRSIRPKKNNLRPTKPFGLGLWIHQSVFGVCLGPKNFKTEKMHRSGLEECNRAKDWIFFGFNLCPKCYASIAFWEN